jgi:hypothetical protein
MVEALKMAAADEKKYFGRFGCFVLDSRSTNNRLIPKF